MSARNALAMVLVLFACATAVIAGVTTAKSETAASPRAPRAKKHAPPTVPIGPQRRPVYPVRWPDGEGRDIAQRGCMICHSSMLVTQQRKDSTAWEKTVKQMETWGAPIAPAAHDSLLRYLRASFGVIGR